MQVRRSPGPFLKVGGMLWLCVFCTLVECTIAFNAGHATQPCLQPALFTPACVSTSSLCTCCLWHAHDVCLFTWLPADFL